MGTPMMKDYKVTEEQNNLVKSEWEKAKQAWDQEVPKA